MLQSLFQSKKTAETLHSVGTIYSIIVGAARKPVFYSDLSVPDTVDGRFDMIILHTFFVLDRLQNSDAGNNKAFSQKLFDYMFADMDRSLRELGVGDLGVPKHMKRMMKGFNGRMDQYHTSLEQSDTQALTESLRKNIFFGADNVTSDQVKQMATYAKAQYAHINKASIDDILSGTLTFTEHKTK